MPVWVLYMLAGIGVVFVLLILSYIVIELVKNGKDRRLRITSLKHTLYSMESDISELNRFAKDQHDIMVDIVASLKDQAVTIRELTSWKDRVHRVTRTWEEFKESGPDGP